MTDVEPTPVKRLPGRPLQPNEFDWTDEHIATLERMWADGGTATDIMTAIGHTSRSAVSGKINRLGLSRYHQRKQRAAALPIPTVKVPPRRGRPERFGPQLVAPPLPWVSKVELPVGRIRFEDLSPEKCRFPVGEMPNLLFCGEFAPNGSYCERCAEIAYQRRRA